ncbi:nucleotidyltransferase family protein [Pseudoroseicyclus sp. CXY001]|uniref:nucleotidyltransferase family protein n=1 Tax=Pseudoroseicyclus sp. CXY001 TaxID=3242492 RepID=UPI00358DD01C
MTHLRLEGAGEAAQRAALMEIVRASPRLMAAFEAARDLDLPDWWIVSGALYNQVWNALTGRPELYGVKDIDLFYFDPDTSWAAEDRVIRAATARFPGEPPLEVRNQARVHLWYEQHFGRPCPAYRNSRQPIDHFACRTHCVGMKLLESGDFEIYAPYGLGDIFAFRLTPNPVMDNRATHEAKAARAVALWPELAVEPWPGLRGHAIASAATPT